MADAEINQGIATALTLAINRSLEGKTLAETNPLANVNGYPFNILSSKGSSCFGSISGANKYAGGVLSHLGEVFFIAYSNATFMRVDPLTGTTTTLGSLTGTGKFLGGVLTAESRILAIPHNHTAIYTIDAYPSYTTATYGSFTGANKWAGGVLGPNNKVYGIPFTHDNILVIDTLAKTTTFLGTYAGIGKWHGGVLAPNGKIYCIPYNSSTILVIDPIAGTSFTFGSLPLNGAKWAGGALAPNGKIYCAPSMATTILVIDPSTNTYYEVPYVDGGATGGEIPASQRFYGATVGLDGKVQFIPCNQNHCMEIDPYTDVVTNHTYISGSMKFFGGVLLPNGNIYCVPHTRTNIGLISRGADGNQNWALTPQVNKY